MPHAYLSSLNPDNSVTQCVHLLFPVCIRVHWGLEKVWLDRREASRDLRSQESGPCVSDVEVPASCHTPNSLTTLPFPTAVLLSSVLLLNFVSVKAEHSVGYNLITLFCNWINNLSNSAVDWAFGRIYEGVKIYCFPHSLRAHLMTFPQWRLSRQTAGRIGWSQEGAEPQQEDIPSAMNALSGTPVTWAFQIEQWFSHHLDFSIFNGDA